MLDSVSYDIKTTLKSHFWHEKVMILPNICDVIMTLLNKSITNGKGF